MIDREHAHGANVPTGRACSGWCSDDPETEASAGAVVGAPTCAEPEGVELYLSVLRRAAPRDEPAHPDCAGGRHQPAPPRAHGLRCQGPGAGAARELRRVAKDAASGPEPVAATTPPQLKVHAKSDRPATRGLASAMAIAYLRVLTEHGAQVGRCRLQRLNAEGRKTQGGRSVETADESATGSVFLWSRVMSRPIRRSARESAEVGLIDARGTRPDCRSSASGRRCAHATSDAVAPATRPAYAAAALRELPCAPAFAVAPHGRRPRPASSPRARIRWPRRADSSRASARLERSLAPAPTSHTPTSCQMTVPAVTRTKAPRAVQTTAPITNSARIMRRRRSDPAVPHMSIAARRRASILTWVEGDGPGRRCPRARSRHFGRRGLPGWSSR